VKEKIWHPSQIIAEHKDGSIDISMEVSALSAVKRFVLQFGSQAELLEPKEMRKEIKEELTKASCKY
jgi:predicted DNA-binding transcriptional regulator YafY